MPVSAAVPETGDGAVRLRRDGEGLRPPAVYSNDVLHEPSIHNAETRKPTEGTEGDFLPQINADGRGCIRLSCCRFDILTADDYISYG